MVALPGSEAFGGTTKVSPYPVRLGTTYLDAGPAGQRPGAVMEYDPWKHIAFHHTMLLKKGPLTANIDAHIRYTLSRKNGPHASSALSISRSKYLAC
jgi:hypothetical protein